ncbi:MAG: P63C domain-containing protein [Acidobacteriia bacterium]|nr:P63C domain-containing protein [Terriglobia bacterium]
MEKLSPEQRSQLAKSAADKRWARKRTIDPVVNHGDVPKAKLWGELQIGEKLLPCYHLANDVRVFSLKGVVVSLIETEGGQLAEYIKVKSLRDFLPNDLVPAENDQIPALIQFDTGGEGFTKYAWGLPVEKFIDLCEAYSRAAETAGNLTERQVRIAINANAFLRACAKVGIIALVDEATGYQAQRPLDELQLKLKLFLAEEMRKWEKTFPDDLWVQFGRLTNWKGTLHQRPKYWGKLVMELIYEYLDPDVAQWLRDNAPKPIHGQNYFLWMNEQYGLKKLIEHIWKVIGIASTCSDMEELRKRMQELYGKRPGFQFELKLAAPKAPAPTSTAQ